MHPLVGPKKFPLPPFPSLQNKLQNKILHKKPMPPGIEQQKGGTRPLMLLQECIPHLGLGIRLNRLA